MPPSLKESNLPRVIRRNPCVGLVLCAAAGIFCAEIGPCNLPLALTAALCFGAAALWGKRLRPFCLFVAACFFVRHQLDWWDAPGRYLAGLADEGTTIVHGEGIVTDDPAALGVHASHVRFPMRVTSLVIDGRKISTSLPAMTYWAGNPPAWGDKVEFSADIQPLLPPRNPGEFDEPAYLARSGIFRELACTYAGDNHIVASGQGNPIIAGARASRAELQRRLTLGIDDSPEVAGLVETLTLGLKKELPREDRDLFQRTGTMHLFVVNGLHIALLAGVLQFLLKPLGLRRRAFAAVMIPLLFAYALLTGLSPGSVRAAIMAAVMFGAAFVDRKPFSWNSLAAAAFILLCWDTNELFHPGFQFSFGVVSAILLLAGWFQKSLLPIGLPDPYLPRTLWNRWQNACAAGWRHAADLIGVSTAACIGAMPFTAGYFHLVTPSAILANLVIVPVAAAILGEAVLSLLGSLAAGACAVLCNNTNWLLGWTMLKFVHLFAWLPGSYLYVAPSLTYPDCQITVLDLSPGQAVFIRSHGQSWLVDCGSDTEYHRVVQPFLQSSGVNRLDGLILTHGGASTEGAALSAIADFSPAKIVESGLPDRSPSHAALERVPKTIVQAGDQFALSSAATVKVLFPPPDFPGRTAADRSMVLEIDAARKRILLMSDSGFATEHWLMEHGAYLRADLLIERGGSSDLFATTDFLEAVQPRAVIEGAPSPYASVRTNDPLAAALQKRGIAAFRQEDTGAVIVRLQPTTWTMTGFMNNQRLVRQSE